MNSENFGFQKAVINLNLTSKPFMMKAALINANHEIDRLNTEINLLIAQQQEEKQEDEEEDGEKVAELETLANDADQNNEPWLLIWPLNPIWKLICFMNN